MEHLFKAWPDFTAAVKAAPHVLLLADYDGTLAQIVAKPEDAVLSKEIRDILAALQKKPAFSVGVISGRSIAELKALVAIAGIYYSGNHGMEIEGPDLNYIHPQAGAARATMRDLAAQLAVALESIAGVIVQQKGLSVSVHYRLAKPDNENAIAGAVKRITARPSETGEIKVYPMKKLWEVRPTIDWDKGKAVEFIGGEIKRNLVLPRLLTVYLGDDTTDEDAFRVLRPPAGWGVFIGEGKAASSAAYYLDSVAEVEEFLDRLMKLK